jgi:hypothetical protein
MDTHAVFLRITPGFPPGNLPKAVFGPVASLMLNQSIMLIAGLIIAGFAVTGVVLGIFIAKTAPVGYQDETGFHFGTQSASVPQSVSFELPKVKAA